MWEECLDEMSAVHHCADVVEAPGRLDAVYPEPLNNENVAVPELREIL
jgi:hypothetical protein